MAYRARLHREANRELKLAECYFDAWNRKDEFLEDFNNQIERIEEDPYLFQLRYRDIRIINFDQFSYSIHYTVNGILITVVAILGQEQSY